MSRKAKRRLIIVPLLVLLYLGLIVFGGCADRLILFPTTNPIDPRGAERLELRRGDDVIEVWTARSPAVRGEPLGFVLEFTGNATRAEQIASFVAERWSELPVDVWVMNYPGYGGSTGGARLRSIAPAALHAYDELLKIAGNRPIFVAGNSLGTAPALYVAAERPVAGLMLQNPPPMRQIIWREFGWWNLWLLAGPLGFAIPSELDSIANARRVRSPAIFITSMKDEVVPVKYQKLVINVFRGPRNVMELENGDHNWALTPIEERELKMHLAWLWVKGTPVPIPPSTAAATRLSEPQVEHEVEADVQRDVDREAGD